MRTKVVFAALFCFAMAFCDSVTFGQNFNLDFVIKSVKWQVGPAVADLGNIAQIEIPENCAFANASDAKMLMEAMQNPTSGKELGLIACKPNNWFALFDFTETGYIKNDEKDSLNASKILEALKKNNDLANEERKKRGWKLLYFEGWYKTPYYNPENHNLEWTVQVRGDGQEDKSFRLNHNSRILGRKGVMNVTLVCDDQTFTQDLPDFNAIIGTFGYKSGNRYEEFVKGDKVAAYGLTGLIVGGAAAVAAKTGFFKWAWKIIVGVVIAIIAFFRKIFGRKNK